MSSDIDYDSLRKLAEGASAEPPKQGKKRSAVLPQNEQLPKASPVVKVPKMAIPKMPKMPKEVVVLSEEEREQRDRMLIILRKYINHPRFKDILAEGGVKPAIMTSLAKKGPGELQDELKKWQTMIASRKNEDLMRDMASTGLVLYETVTSRYINTKGVASVIESDESFQDSLAELSILYSMPNLVRPELRLAYSIASCTVLCMQSNRMMSRLHENQSTNNVPIQHPAPALHGTQTATYQPSGGVVGVPPPVHIPALHVVGVPPPVPVPPPPVVHDEHAFDLPAIVDTQTEQPKYYPRVC